MTMPESIGTLRHRSCSAPTALDGQQHRRSAGERHDRDRYRGHVRAGRRQRRLGFVAGLIPMIAGSRIVRRTRYHHLVNRPVTQAYRGTTKVGPGRQAAGPLHAFHAPRASRSGAVGSPRRHALATSTPSSAPSFTAKEVASVSWAIRSRNRSTSATLTDGTVSTRAMRSAMSRSAALRASWHGANHVAA